MDALVRRSFRR